MSAVFGIDASAIGSDDSPETIAEWDSVRHLQIMLALEEEFGIQFDASELASLGSVAMIEQRLGAGARDG
jgi:acyl carrier protein